MSEQADARKDGISSGFGIQLRIAEMGDDGAVSFRTRRGSKSVGQS